ncbi:MAG: hypothetical protein ACE5FF_08320 [Saprospiraceae bacterium]
MAIHWNTEKLNKCLSRIDGAIMAGKYNLALKLAHRYLRQYYLSFVKRHNVPLEQLQPENVRYLAITICRYLNSYFRKYDIPFSERRLMFISLVSNIIFIATMNLYDSRDDYLADKAMATYARENVGNIISYLLRYYA